MASIDAFSDLERRMDGFQKDVAQVLARQPKPRAPTAATVPSGNASIT